MHHGQKREMGTKINEFVVPKYFGKLFKLNKFHGTLYNLHPLLYIPTHTSFKLYRTRRKANHLREEKSKFIRIGRGKKERKRGGKR